MTGGIRAPRVEAQASIAAECVGEKPAFFIAGMVIGPVVSTFDATLPLIEPNSAEAKIATLAEPPRTLPSRAKATLMKKTPAPVYCMATPNTKTGSAPCRERVLQYG